MEISAIKDSVPVAPSPAAIPAEQAVENRELIHAVKALNGTELFGHDNELVFQRDAKTHRMVIRMVNRETKEVVSQIPPEYVLRLAEDTKKSSQ